MYIFAVTEITLAFHAFLCLRNGQELRFMTLTKIFLLCKGGTLVMQSILKLNEIKWIKLFVIVVMLVTEDALHAVLFTGCCLVVCFLRKH